MLADGDAGHVVMGVAMAGMLVARLRIVPPAAWEAVFAAGAAWFAWQFVRSRGRTPASPWRCAHPAPHLVECAAMLYMRPGIHPSGPAVRGTVQDRDWGHHGIHADPDALETPVRKREPIPGEPSSLRGR